MKDISTLSIGLIIGLVIGLVVGYAFVSKSVDATALERQVNKLEAQVKDKDATISTLESQVSDLSTQISNLQGELQTKTNQLGELQIKLNEKDAEITKLRTQITNLKSQIADLEAQIEELEKLVPPSVKGEWNLITTFTGSTSKTTSLFRIPSGYWRINWQFTGPSLSIFTFSVHLEGETFYEESLMAMGPSKSDTTYLYVGPGNFYIEVEASLIEQWTLTIEAFIPE